MNLRAPLLVLVTLALGGAFEARADETTLFVPDAIVTDLDESAGRFVTGLVASEIGARPGLSVLTAAEAAELLAMEAERQALGCAEESCLAELADAVGATYLVTARLGRVGDALRLDLTLVDTAAATVTARAQTSARDLLDLGERVQAVVHNLLVPLVGGEVRTLAPPDLARRMFALETLGPAAAVGATAATVMAVPILASLSVGFFAPGVFNFDENEPTLQVFFDEDLGLPARLALATTALAIAPLAIGAATALAGVVADAVHDEGFIFWRALALTAYGATGLMVVVGGVVVLGTVGAVGVAQALSPEGLDADPIDYGFVPLAAASTPVVAGVVGIGAAAIYTLGVGLFPASTRATLEAGDE